LIFLDSPDDNILRLLYLLGRNTRGYTTSAFSISVSKQAGVSGNRPVSLELLPDRLELLQNYDPQA
jgi:hypothetical protein